MSPDQRIALGATQMPISTTSSADAPGCSFASLTGPSFGVFIDVTRSAASVVTGASGSNEGTIDINGFDVQLLGLDSVSACSGFVDTGDGQYLSVQANSLDELPAAQLCDAVEPALQVVLDNLADLQPS